jgi:DNA-binding transcriptional regulator YhcF (GntR family)
MDAKSLKIYKYLLDQLESGRWDSGSKFPGARKLAVEAGCGFPLMQTVIEILCQQGILMTKARSGTYVTENWRQRVLACNFFIPSYVRINNAITQSKRFPEMMRISKEFERGMFELRVSHCLLSHHEEYYDLSEVFDELYPDKSDFFQEAIAPFYVGKKLCGVPLVFSPRIMLCNKAMFKEASCPLPDLNWSWDEFIETLEKLKNRFPDRVLINLTKGIFHWSTFLFRFGGQIYAPDSDDPVRIDCPESITALQHYAELLRNYSSFEMHANAGTLYDYALLSVPRQNLYRYPEEDINGHFHPVKLPLPAGGMDINNQAVELLCVRKECTDIDLLKTFLKFMLSSEIQENVGATGYGLPIRKSSAYKLKDSNSELAKLYYSEIEHISSEYHIFSPELYKMTAGAIILCLQEDCDQKIERSIKELGQALRIFCKVKKLCPL